MYTTEESMIKGPCDGCVQKGCCNLHQEGYEIFERDEDDPKGNHIKVDRKGKTTVIYDELKNNPSPRRHGIKIKFFCEQSDNIFYLNMWQHKGNTFYNWDVEEKNT